jgi:hypothetical protein
MHVLILDWIPRVREILFTFLLYFIPIQIHAAQPIISNLLSDRVPDAEIRPRDGCPSAGAILLQG